MSRLPKARLSLFSALSLVLLAVLTGCSLALLPVAEPTHSNPEMVEGTILFQSDRSGNWDIFVLNNPALDGSSEPRNLTNTPFNEQDPSWSPDGSQITFASDENGFYEIYIMDADGTNRQRLTTNRIAYDRQPRWLPSGETIAFTSQRNRSHDSWQVYVEEFDRVVKLHDDVPWIDSQSPDGLFLYTRRRGEQADIYIQNKIDRTLLQLTDSPLNEVEPRWSPDYSQVIYASDESSNGGADKSFNIYVADYVDGTLQNARPLTNSPAADRYPAWQPINR